MHERKKRLVRKLVQDFKRMLKLQGYRTTTRFKTAREDKDIKSAYAIVEIDNACKTIYIRFSSFDFNRMKIREIKRYVMHELLHSYFGELNELLVEVLERGNFTEAKKRSFTSKFDRIEHQKISHLIRVMFTVDRLERQFRKKKLRSK